MDLHFAINDKFIDHFIYYLEKLESSENLIFIPTEDQSLSFIKRKESVIRCEPSLEGIYEKIGSLEDYDRIYIHYLTGLMVDFLNSLPNEIKPKIIWIFFGADAFNTDLFIASTYDKKTSNLIKIINKGKRSIIGHLKRRYRISLRRRAVKKVDFFAHYLLEDYLLVKKKFKNKSQFIEFNHGGFALFNNLIPDKYVDGDNILIGNSANPSNNHLESMDLLQNYEIGKSKVICPLSYGGEQIYAEAIATKGEEIFGNRFSPLREFITRENYFSILSKVKFAIMNQNRSQAGGNILTLIWMGKYVFMKENNTFFRFIKAMGIQVFSMEIDFPSFMSDTKSFPKMDLVENRKLIMNYFSETSSAEFYRKLMDSSKFEM